MNANGLRPVAKQSAESQATDSLRDYILSGRVAPGARLKELQLAEELQVARATLRTSLMRLVSEGIVVQIPYTGWQVMALSATDVWELWTLRGSLESLASKLAAERMNSEIEKAVEAAFERLVTVCKTGTVMQASECDFALHRTIIDSVQHSRLAGQYRHVEQQIRFYIATSNALTADNLPAIITQHEPMIEALLSRDPVRAAQTAWLHNESEGGKLVASLRKQEREKRIAI